jgi:hypothetical protein
MAGHERSKRKALAFNIHQRAAERAQRIAPDAKAGARGYRNVNAFMTMIYPIGAPLGKLLDHFSRQLILAESI